MGSGGASGIGAAICAALAGAGAAVVVADVAVEAGTAVAASLDGATFERLDVADPDAWDRIVALHPELDIVVLNAGVTTRTDRPEVTVAATDPTVPLQDLTDGDYRRALGVNLDGVVFGARAVLPAMCARGGGDVLVTASLAGLVGMEQDPIYSVTKHAVVGLTRSLAPGLDRFGVCISSLNPGFVDTPILAGGVAPMLRELDVPVIPPSRIGDAALHALRVRSSGAQWVVWGDRPPAPYDWRPPV